MTWNIERNDRLLIDAGNNNWDGFYVCQDEATITILLYVPDEEVTLDKAGILEVYNQTTGKMVFPV